MSVRFDRDVVERSCSLYEEDIRELERQRQDALAISSGSGNYIVSMIDSMIIKKKEELNDLKYALKYMT